MSVGVRWALRHLSLAFTPAQVEVKIHSILKHRHIVGFKHFFEDDNAYYMILELAHNKSFSEVSTSAK